jgi:hypothetical protein
MWLRLRRLIGISRTAGGTRGAATVIADTKIIAVVMPDTRNGIMGTGTAISATHLAGDHNSSAVSGSATSSTSSHQPNAQPTSRTQGMITSENSMLLRGRAAGLRLELGIPVEIIEPAFVQIVRREHPAVLIEPAPVNTRGPSGNMSEIFRSGVSVPTKCEIPTLTAFP